MRGLEVRKRQRSEVRGRRSDQKSEDGGQSLPAVSLAGSKQGLMIVD
jgi:hypothetical protein